MTKKAKNTSLIAQLAKEVEMPAPELLENCVVEVTKDSYSVTADDGSFGFGGFEANEDYVGPDGALVRSEKLSDKPIVTIGGNEIALKETTAPVIGIYGNELNLSVFESKRGSQLYTSRDLERFKEPLKWYTAKVGGIEIIISGGSTLVVTESIDSRDYWYEDDVPAGPAKLTVLGGTIETRNLVIRGINTINNAYLIAGQYVELNEVTAECTQMNSDSNIVISKSALSGAVFQGMNTNYINITKCNLDDCNFGGFARITLREVRAFNHRKFWISGFGRPGSKSPCLDISNTTLESFEGTFASLTEACKHWSDPSNGWNEPTITIARRLDYGHFSAHDMIPFARVGSLDLLVGEEVFMASEFFPVDKGETHYVAKAPEPATYGGGLCGTMSSPNFGFGVLNTGATYRGTVLWNRAAKVIFGHQYGKQPIGRTGEAMVNTLIEQIKSRIGIYVEIANIKLQ